jgi:chorismate-pyruvate lyase
MNPKNYHNTDVGSIPKNNRLSKIDFDHWLMDARQQLSLFQKILMTTDGTVTNLLQLYTNEPIKVKKIDQDIFLSGTEETYLCPAETPILKRDILLCGRTKNYIYATSIFVFENLSRDIQYKLLETNIPIGLLWKEEKLETYREIFDYNLEACGNLSQYFDVSPLSLLLSRSYLIYSKFKVMGVITEKFPLSYFNEP